MARWRLDTIGESTLRGWLRALEACPGFLPWVRDLRIAVRNELWDRATKEERQSAWLQRVLEEWNA